MPGDFMQMSNTWRGTGAVPVSLLGLNPASGIATNPPASKLYFPGDNTPAGCLMTSKGLSASTLHPLKISSACSLAAL